MLVYMDDQVGTEGITTCKAQRYKDKMIWNDVFY